MRPRMPEGALAGLLPDFGPDQGNQTMQDHGPLPYTHADVAFITAGLITNLPEHQRGGFTLGQYGEVVAVARILHELRVTEFSDTEAEWAYEVAEPLGEWLAERPEILRDGVARHSAAVRLRARALAEEASA